MAILSYIADDNIEAAQTLKNVIDDRVRDLPNHPHMYKAGRVEGTREIVVQPNYIVVYAENDNVIYILRILHARQQWTSKDKD